MDTSAVTRRFDLTDGTVLAVNRSLAIVAVAVAVVALTGCGADNKSVDKPVNGTPTPTRSPSWAAQRTPPAWATYTAGDDWARVTCKGVAGAVKLKQDDEPVIMAATIGYAKKSSVKSIRDAAQRVFEAAQLAEFREGEPGEAEARAALVKATAGLRAECVKLGLTYEGLY